MKMKKPPRPKRSGLDYYRDGIGFDSEKLNTVVTIVIVTISAIIISCPFWLRFIK